MRLPRWTHVGVFVLVLDACGWLNAASAVEDPAVYFAQAIGRVAREVRTATNLTNFGYNEGLSLYGALLRTGASTSLRQELSPGVTYLLLGGGDDDATDVDLEIFDPSGRQVARDTDDDATPAVRFTPNQGGFFLIRVSLEASRDGTSFCAMAILRDGGWNVPIENMTKAATKALQIRGELGQRGLGRMALRKV